MAETFDLPISSSEVRKRLALGADRPTKKYWIVPGLTQGKPVVGEISGDTFSWRVRHRERDTFAPWITGRIEDRGAGSRVVIQTHSPFGPRARLVVTLAVVALALLWRAVTPSPTLDQTLFGLAAVLAVVVLPLAATRMLSFERKQLLEHFREAVESADGSPRITEQ